MMARPLTRARILQTAFRLADKGGLEAVTMRSVAAKLGVEAMSLYHHVPNKKAMMDGLVDLLVQVADLPSGDLSTEQWIRGTARGLRGLAQQHPRVVPLLSSGPVPLDDPVSAQPFEAGLAAFCREGRDVGQAFAAVQAVLLSLLALTQLESTAALSLGSVEETALSELTTVDFPLLSQVTSAPVGIDDFWDTLVEGLVRGLAPR